MMDWCGTPSFCGCFVYIYIHIFFEQILYCKPACRNTQDPIQTHLSYIILRYIEQTLIFEKLAGDKETHTFNRRNTIKIFWISQQWLLEILNYYSIGYYWDLLKWCSAALVCAEKGAWPLACTGCNLLHVPSVYNTASFNALFRFFSQSKSHESPAHYWAGTCRQVSSSTFYRFNKGPKYILHSSQNLKIEQTSWSTLNSVHQTRIMKIIIITINKSPKQRDIFYHPFPSLTTKCGVSNGQGASELGLSLAMARYEAHRARRLVEATAEVCVVEEVGVSERWPWCGAWYVLIFELCDLKHTGLYLEDV